MICDNCKAPDRIKSTLGCACDRWHNAVEVLKRDIAKQFNAHYEPEYVCRYADVLEEDDVQ